MRSRHLTRGVQELSEARDRASGHVRLEPDESRKRFPPDRIRSGGSIVIVAVTDEVVAAIYFGAGTGPEDMRPRLIIGGESAK